MVWTAEDGGAPVADGSGCAGGQRNGEGQRLLGAFDADDQQRQRRGERRASTTLRRLLAMRRKRRRKERKRDPLLDV
ncbi:hypothetical protein Scep_019583 [Stephania cephalantha]|uniref:Uncharacterized protein n=1 Tax=Stephania cephalantha TaxID=152367 RepID=A0AAP0IB18_9MAGN